MTMQENSTPENTTSSNNEGINIEVNQAPSVTSKVFCLDPAHIYEVSGNQLIKFIKRVDGELLWEGTTNEELLTVLIDRTKALDEKFPCRENAMAITKLEEALLWFNERTAKRIAQGVETRAVAHEDKPVG